jgi:internalin A
LVGQGGVGKTSLVQRLVYDRHNPEEGQTKGINIETWELPLGGKRVRLNIWDFGGQEIMHATHQFFLTARTLYLLVLDARQGEHVGRLEYWLALIQSFAGDSPVLVVMNKCDEHHLDLNRRGLQQKYPMIQGFVSVSARSGMGMDELKQVIHQALSSMPHIDSALPSSWYRVKEKLAQLQGQHDYIPYSQYQQLCQQAGVEDDTSQRTLIRFLHDLGGALNFQDDDRVRDTSVLNPEWVTQGVYALLNNDELREHGGVLERRQVPRLLDNTRYPLERQRLILSLMEKFELAFAFEGSERYLVPDLLPVEQPAFDWEDEGSLLFEYHYAVLPRSILHRFMVRLHPFIYERIAWRTGVMLVYEGMKALVKADIEDKQIRIAIHGGGRRREFLSMLRFTFDSLHENITGTKPQEYVPIPDYPGKAVSYKHLLRLEERGDTEYLPDGVDEPVDVQALLGSIEDPAYRRQGAFTRQEIYKLLRDGYSTEDEVGELCFLLGIDAAELGGDSTAAKMRELVVYMERHGRIQDLITHLQKERPNLFHGRKRT